MAKVNSHILGFDNGNFVVVEKETVPVVVDGKETIKVSITYADFTLTMEDALKTLRQAGIPRSEIALALRGLTGRRKGFAHFGWSQSFMAVTETIEWA